MESYQTMLEKALADEIATVRLYLACMAVAPPGDIPTLLEINADETDHVALIAGLLSKLTGKPVDYAAMIGGAD